MEEGGKVYHRLFESANAGILIIDEDFKFIDCNKMAQRALGRSKNEIVGVAPVDPILSPEYQANGILSSELGARYFSSVLEGKDMRFDWIHLRKNGSPFQVEVSLFQFVDEGIKRFFAVWRDLSEIKIKEAELRESEERFRNIFLQASDGALIIKLNSGFIDCNEAAIKKLGYDAKEDLIGKLPWELSPQLQPDGKKSIEKAKFFMHECMAKGMAQFDWIHSKKNGGIIWFEVLLTRITVKKEDLIYVNWRDISEKKKNEEELEKYRNHLEDLVTARTNELEEALNGLKEAQSQLVQSEKMASLGVLAAGVAHEINNPLNYILGSYAGLVKYLGKKGIEDQQINRLLDILKHGVDRASEIVTGLTSFSGSSERMDEVCDIQSIIDNCLLVLHSQINTRIVLTKEYASDSVEVQGNSGLLHQAFVNILMNSVQAIQGEGTLRVSVKREGKYASVEVFDSGQGIGHEDLTKVFDPFFTTKDPGKGTGLGLTNTYQIIHAHRGKIELESSLNKGTTAKVSLPINQTK